MPTHASRRDFLRADLTRTIVLRPPGALTVAFERACTGCGECASACPEAIIHTDHRGSVMLDLSRGACTFCGECARACPTDALDVGRIGDWPWVATVGETCLSINNVACRSCEDACEARAIRFRLEVGGKARPNIDATECTGCGACIAICPVGAVSLARTAQSEPELRP
ncbi:ferredoxin-type protein NapF [Tropicimonas marinistellae]|uniref:ferredoxin-type protein NapF n=1 Tax=Tropicimonas marinistellae TaxID=1739787 RepID=UPI00098F597E|nr:ferredoxin-type protein NapF [Tropicimonas marinistellae]